MYQGEIRFADGNVGERPITREESGILLPTDEEINTWMLKTLGHSLHVEYFLEQLNYGRLDPQRPHDIVGPGNKYEWDVIKGLALQFRTPKVDFNKYMAPSREFHRKGQYHHLKWNGDKPNPNASPDDMLVGAVDSVCALLEDREYSGGPYRYIEAQRILDKNPAHKVHYINIVIPQMKNLIQPDLESITDLSDIPNIGVSKNMHEKIVQRTAEAVEMLEHEHGFGFLEFVPDYS